MAENRNEFQIRAGMDVVDRNGDRLGNLDTIFSENETGISRFIVVEQRILPVETIENVEGDRVKVTIEQEKLREFPERRENEMPTPEEQQKAYQVIDLSGPLVGRPGGGEGPGA